MKQPHRLLGLGVVVLLGLAFAYRQQIVLRITGVRPFFPQRRIDGWVARGADGRLLDAALRRIHDPDGSGPGSWVYELSIPAAAHRARAEEREAAGDAAGAAEAYRLAALYYGIARFPYVSSPAKAEAYRQHRECYLKAAARFNPPLDVVRIPFEGEEIIGYLRVPAGPPPPVVVLTGGVDTWKSDDDLTVEAMLREGLATFSFDMPGTGESAWPLTPDGDRIYRRAIDALRDRPDLAGERLALYLRSFAGHYAVKLAVTEPRVVAAVNVGGPIDLSFTAEHARSVPVEMVRTIAHAMRVDPEMPFEEMIERLRPMSLATQGLLQRPARQAALLSINGDQDPLVTIDDLYIISRSGIVQEEWVYAGDGHVAAAHAAEHIPRAAAWLKAHLAPAVPAEAPAPAPAASAA